MYQTLSFDKFYKMWKQNEKGNYVLRLDNVYYTIYKKSENSKFYFVSHIDGKKRFFYPNPFVDVEQAMNWLYEGISDNTDLLTVKNGTSVVEWNNI